MTPYCTPYEAAPSPCFILEETLLRKNLELIRSVQDASGGQIILALKGFSMFSAFPVVKEYLDGATASSLNEIKLINDYFGTKAHTYMPAYLPAEFSEVLERSSHITFNSLSQWERFRNQVSDHNERHADEKVSCGIRINPQYSEVEVDMYNPCVPGSRLGVTADQLGSRLPEGIEG